MVPTDFSDREKFCHFEITEISDHKNLPKKPLQTIMVNDKAEGS